MARFDGSVLEEEKGGGGGINKCQLGHDKKNPSIAAGVVDHACSLASPNITADTGSKSLIIGFFQDTLLLKNAEMLAQKFSILIPRLAIFNHIKKNDD